MTFSTLTNNIIEVEFNVFFGEDPYLTKTDAIVARIEQVINSRRAPNLTFIEGKIGVDFHDGHNGVTDEMGRFLEQLRNRLGAIGVKMRGSGLGAYDFKDGVAVGKVRFKCAIHHEFDFKTMETMW